MPQVHARATLTGDVRVADDVQIGPHCIITGPVTLGPGVRLLGHAYINGPVTIGAGTIVYPFACLGFEPQDYKFKPGSKTAGAVIGSECLIREHATVHAASNEHTPTRVGNRVFMMVGSHIAHDCTVGNNVVMVNNSAFAGHCTIGDNVTVGGGGMIHQFCRIGRFAMISGNSGTTQDVPPFCMVIQTRRLAGINVVGMRRNGFSRDDISAVREAFRLVLRNPVTRSDAVAMLREIALRAPIVTELAEFVATTKRGIAPGMGKPLSSAMRRLGDEDSEAALA